MTSKKKKHKKSSRILLIKNILFVFQIVISILLVGAVILSGMLPARYIVALTVFLVLLVLVTYMLLNRKEKIWMAGAAFAAIVSLICCVAFGYLNQMRGLLNESREKYKVDEMVVVVLADDPAETLADTGDYVFGIQTSVDQVNTQAMIKDVEENLGKKITIREYETPRDEASALLNKEIGAAIYNNSYTSMLDDLIEGYTDQVKIIYNYGIEQDLEAESVDPGEPFNVLISGIDVRENVLENSRSDVNIIVTINPKTKKIILTSTPRDFYVPISGVSGQARDKLTHAGIYGVDASMRTLEDLYGIDITYYVRVNFNTLVQVVNALDGVDVYIEEGFQPFTDSEIYIESGWQTLDGREALAYCRERYSFADGDNQRGRNQETVLQAIIAKICSPSILLNAGDFMSSLEGAFQTDIPNAKIQELINQQLSDSTPWQVFKQAPTSENYQMQPTYSGGPTPLSVVYPDYYIVKQCSARINIIMEGR